MKYKTDSLYTEAQQIREYYEKNKKMPLTCTLTTGETITPYTIAYLFCLMIIDNFKHTSYESINVRVYDPSKHYEDTITSENVMKDDYLVMVNNFIKFSRNHHRVPRFITTQKSQTKVSFELFLYCLSKIVYYYKQNKTLPNYCNFTKGFIPLNETSNGASKKTNKQSISNCSNPYKSLPINPNTGCDAMGQNTSYYCGVSALQKVLYKFGIHIKQSELAKIAGTTTKGTDHNGLKTAIAYVAKKHNVKLTVKEYSFSELGFEKVAKMICKPDVDIIWHLLYRNKYGHYEKVKAIDLSKKTVDVINSLGNKCSNGCYCGYIETRTFATQKQYISGISQKSLIVITRGG